MWATASTMLASISKPLEWICRGFSHSEDSEISPGFPSICREDDVALDPDSACESSSGTEAMLHKYDVFINHRGCDTKKGIVAHLNGALRKAGFHPFLDAKSIGQGKHVFKSIDEALSGACVHVAIFSKRYAESKYCLNELSDMLQSKRVILPVFYDIEPEDLRQPHKGPFAKAFRKHYKRGRHKDIKRWERALLEVASRRGFRPIEVNGDEHQLIRRIVVAIQGEMPDIQQPQHYRVGLEESTKEVVGKLDVMGDSVGVIGLYGMGGIGKTTLANEVYNHYASSRTFQHRSFLKDVRGSKVLDLQQQLVHDLFKEHLKSSEDYPYYFNRFKGLRMLIVVDDIDEKYQFDQLIFNLQELANGTRILVTSRERDVLNRTMGHIRDKALHEVKVLNTIEARQLFNWHAFYNEIPDRGFEHLAVKVADACSGHPLALESVGATLFDKKDPQDKPMWLDAIKTMNSNGDIQNKLRITYDGLPSDAERMMFLDVACLLIGEHEEVALEIWESCDTCYGGCATSKGPTLALRILKDKSLVKLNALRQLSMHDVLRDMGRDIVARQSPSNPGKRSHLWHSLTTAKVLEKKQGTHKVRGILTTRLPTIHFTTPTYAAESYANMSELHYLVLDDCCVQGDFSKWSEELRWLRWRSFPLAELPLLLKLPNVAVLDLTNSGKLLHLWQHDMTCQQVLHVHLKRLVLKNCSSFQDLPHDIGRRLPKLKTLDLEGCSMIKTLPQTIGQLKHLQHLILSGCENLQMLPETIVNLTKLETLLLNGCIKIEQLPMEFGRLSNLEDLNLHKCKLQELPLSVSELMKLRMLDLGSTAIEKLPEQFGQLTNLIELRLNKCESLRSLPSNIGDLQLLRTLTVTNTLFFPSLPGNFGALTALTRVEMEGNQKITVLPESFKDLKSLVHLQIFECPALVKISTLPQSLTHLDVANCPMLNHLPSFADLSLLTTIVLCNCTSLTNVKGLDSITGLEEVNITGCSSMLPSELKLKHNRVLRMCCLSGSNIAVEYDNNWSQKEPELQVISYYDNALRLLSDGMARKIVAEEYCKELILETSITCEAECVAAIFCFVAHDQGFSDHRYKHGRYLSECFLELRIMREGEEVFFTDLYYLRHADCRDQVYLCTLRRKHPLVRFLRRGDTLCLYARSRYQAWAITVQEASVCTVHGEHQHQLYIVNSESLNGNRAHELRMKFEDLVLADNPECPNGQINRVSHETVTNDHKAMTIRPMYFHHVWNPLWVLPNPARGIISFTAKGVSNVQISLAMESQDMEPRYEICIGTWSNTGSRIRKHRSNKEKPDLIRVETALSNPGEMNNFWVSIDEKSRMIKVGEGLVAGQDEFLVYEDLDFLSGVTRIGFSTWDTPVSYSNIEITAID